MTNAEIICNEAIASGFYTKEEVEELLSEGLMPEMHTYAIWKTQFNMVPRAGQHGWECRLWRRKNKKDDIEEQQEASEVDKNKDFYLTKSFLFHISQVEELKESKAVQDLFHVPLDTMNRRV